MQFKSLEWLIMQFEDPLLLTGLHWALFNQSLFYSVSQTYILGIRSLYYEALAPVLNLFYVIWVMYSYTAQYDSPVCEPSVDSRIWE